MNKYVAILGGGVSITILAWYIYKRTHSSTSSSGSAAIGNTNTPVTSGSSASSLQRSTANQENVKSIKSFLGQPIILPNSLPTDSEDAQSNNYVVNALSIINALTIGVKGTVADGLYNDAASDLLNQLQSAWTNSASGVPMYNNKTVLDIYGTLGNGLFAQPSIYGTVYGSQNDKLKAVWANACMVISIAAKNSCQVRYKGQCIGKFQSDVRQMYVQSSQVVDKIDLIKPYTDNLIGALYTSLHASGNGVTTFC